MKKRRPANEKKKARKKTFLFILPKKQKRDRIAARIKNVGKENTMHEELYISDRSKLHIILPIIGGLLLPFSFAVYTVKNGSGEFSFYLDFAMLLPACFFLLLSFMISDKKKITLCYPYFSILGFEFLRFGTVTLFNREIPFDFYIVSAFIMLCAAGYSFILFFISSGKLRSKIPLIVWSVLMTALAIFSIADGIIPFCAYQEIINEGNAVKYVAVSRFISVLLLNLSGFIIGIALKDDKVREEKRMRKAKEKN